MCQGRGQSEQTWTWFGTGPGAPTPVMRSVTLQSLVRKRDWREVRGLPAESAWALSPKDLDSFTLGCYGCTPAQGLHWLADQVLNEFCFLCSKDSSLQIVWPDKLIKPFIIISEGKQIQSISSCGLCCFSCICALVFFAFSMSKHIGIKKNKIT